MSQHEEIEIQKRNNLLEVKRKIQALQQRLGVKIEATIYDSTLHWGDDFRKLASDCRLSSLSYPLKGKQQHFAVKIVADGIGEIPYALWCHECEIYE